MTRLRWLLPAMIAVVVVAAYTPPFSLHRVSTSAGPRSASPGLDANLQQQRAAAWRARPITVSVIRVLAAVPVGSPGSRASVGLCLTAAVSGGLAAWSIARLGAGPLAVLAGALAFVFSAAFSREAPLPTSRLLEAASAATAIILVGLWLDRSFKAGPAKWLAGLAGAVVLAAFDAGMRADVGWLGLALLVVGAGACSREHPVTAAVLGIALAASTALAGHASWFALLAVMLAYSLVGVGMGWLVKTSAGGAGVAAPAVLIFVLPVLNAATHYLAARASILVSSISAETAAVLPRMLPPGAAVAASPSDADLPIEFWRLGVPGPPIATTDGRGLQALMTSGREVFAFDQARLRLEPMGFHFLPSDLVLPELWLSAYLKRLPIGSIVMAGFGGETAPRLLEIARSPFTAATGSAWGQPPLPFYGMVGVVRLGGLDRPFEQNARLAVDLRIDAGDPIGRTPVIAPVPIRVLSDATGVLIDVNRQWVARPGNGVALVVARPNGEVLASHVIDARATLTVPVDDARLRLTQVDGGSGP